MSKIKEYGQHIVLSVLLIGLTVFGIWQYKRAEELEYAQNIAYSRIFTELTSYVDDVEEELLKARLINDPKQLVNLSNKLYSSTSAAKANLCSLPLGEVSVEKTTEFLSQVGDFAHSISMKVLEGKEVTEEDTESIKSLGEYARNLQEGLDELLANVNSGSVSFGKNSVEKLLGGGNTAFANSISDMENELHDYPSLVYDGPFSQHVMNKEAVFLKGKAAIDEQMAKSIAEIYIGSESKSIGKGEGKIPSYYFEKDSKRVEITAAGGQIMWMLNSRNVGEKKLTLNEAKQYAAQFLRRNGFADMTESYYDIKDDCAVINYAYSQEGYTVYPDLVKVKVALDNGEVVGFEGRGYIMNHCLRKIPQPLISSDEAISMVSSSANVESVSKAIIPLDNGEEAFCYELKGKIDDKHFLIYINTQSGAEEKIMILIETETGVLAV